MKEIVIRAAERLAVSAIFVANKNIRLPPSRHVSTIRVAMGVDVADGYIAKSANAGDLAITADIPLAAALVARGAVALDLRGTVYTEENIGAALARGQARLGIIPEKAAAEIERNCRIENIDMDKLRI